MTESLLITAQLAYVYPRLAELADLRGDRAFAAELRASGARDLSATRAAWTGRWYLRGYAGDQPLGAGAIFGEPQPWAMLAGAPDRAQATELVAGIRRFLTGIGAPGGPSPIGSSQSPAADDPGVTEHSRAPGGIGPNNAVYVGGDWFAVNGWLSWGMSRLGVPGAREHAFGEFLRNTLAAHATAYPDHWDGIISVDDVCRSFYSPHPEQCGNGLQTTYAGQIMHQPAWSLFDAIKLAGIEPTAAGYTIDPRLPLRRFSLRLANVSLAASQGGALRGSITPSGPGALRMRVATRLAHPVVTVGGRRVASRRAGRFVSFALRARAGRPAVWGVRAG
jgi:glycosyl hydrolase family 36